jgi:alpha-beta hydrolase superfamily lysophospholipase
MRPSDIAHNSSGKLTSRNRRALLQGIAATVASPALIASSDAIADAARGDVVAAADSNDKQSNLTHRTVSVNGLQFHIAESGQGPLVLLCHGFPECWYSWRHQLPALAEAGFHAVAPDMRGFGQTEAPDDIAEYTIGHNIADMVQLVSALGEQQAVIVGHDWGALVAWNSALLRPDIFSRSCGAERAVSRTPTCRTSEGTSRRWDHQLLLAIFPNAGCGRGGI